MEYNLIVKLDLFPESRGGRAYFRASTKGIIGGIPFHLEFWENEKTITSCIVAPKPGFVIYTPKEILVPLLVESTKEVLSEIEVGSNFVLWEGKVTGEGVILCRFF